MNHPLLVPALALSIGAVFSLPAHATVLVDDFSSGAYSAAFTASPGGTSNYAEQAGTMASGTRQWYLSVYGPDTSGALVDVSPAGFDFRANLGVSHRFDWFYGDTYVGHDHPMDLDFSGENTLRFAFAEAPRGLNFNVLLYYDHAIDNYSQLGLNIGPNESPFNVDFSLADFASHIAVPSRPADMAHVTGIYIVTQSGGFYAGGGEGFRITSISAVPEPGTAALGVAGLLAMCAWRRRAAAPPSAAELVTRRTGDEVEAEQAAFDRAVPHRHAA